MTKIELFAVHRVFFTVAKHILWEFVDSKIFLSEMEKVQAFINGSVSGMANTQQPPEKGVKGP